MSGFFMAKNEALYRFFEADGQYIPANHFPAVLHYLLPAKGAAKRIDANIRARGETICPFASARTKPNT